MLREYSAFHKSVGLSLGSLGIGIEGNYPIGNTFNLRGGFNYVPPVKIGKPGKNDRYKFDRSNINLMLDWQPLFGKESNFASKWFVTIGAGYFFKNELNKYGASNYEKEAYNIKFKQAPYVGTGLGNLVLGERMSLSLNLGYYFEYADSQIRTYDRRVPFPKVDSFPMNIVKGIDAHAAVTYNF